MSAESLFQKWFPERTPVFPQVSFYPKNLLKMDEINLPYLQNQYGFLLPGWKAAKTRNSAAVRTQLDWYTSQVIAAIHPSKKQTLPPWDAVFAFMQDDVLTIAAARGVRGQGYDNNGNAPGYVAQYLLEALQHKTKLNVFFDPQNQTWLHTYQAILDDHPGGFASLQVMQCKPTEKGYQLRAAIMGGKDINGNETTGSALVIPPNANDQPRFFNPPNNIGIDPRHIRLYEQTVSPGSRLIITTDQTAQTQQQNNNSLLFPAALEEYLPRDKTVHTGAIVDFLESMGSGDGGNAIIVVDLAIFTPQS